MRVKFLPVIFAITMIGCSSSSNTNNPKTISYTIDFEQFDLGNSKIYQSSETYFESTLLTYIQQATENTVTSFYATANNRVKIEESDFVEDYPNIKGLIIGSSSNDGQVGLTFNKKLLKATIEIEQYYNIYYGYDFGSKQVEIRYDCQEYNEQLGEYVGYSTITANGNRWKGTGKTYRYNDDYTAMFIDVPERNTATFKIDDYRLTLDGLESERCRIYNITLEFEK